MLLKIILTIKNFPQKFTVFFQLNKIIWGKIKTDYLLINYNKIFINFS